MNKNETQKNIKALAEIVNNRAEGDAVKGTIKQRKPQASKRSTRAASGSQTLTAYTPHTLTISRTCFFIKAAKN